MSHMPYRKAMSTTMRSLMMEMFAYESTAGLEQGQVQPELVEAFRGVEHVAQRPAVHVHEACVAVSLVAQAQPVETLLDRRQRRLPEQPGFGCCSPPPPAAS
jgi:hypothetical protein